MQKLTNKQVLFLLTYPFAHLAVLGIVFLISDWLNAWNSPVFSVLFMAVFLLIAPVLAFPANLTEINTIFSGWHPVFVFSVVYAALLVIYAMPILLAYKIRKRR